MDASEARYEGHAFHPSLPGGKSSGEIIVTPGALVFSGGGRSVSLPFAGLAMKSGGASDRLLFFTHPGHADWSVYTADRGILRDANLAAHPELIGQVQQARHKRRVGWAIFAAVLVLIVAIPAFLLFHMDWITRQVAAQVPVEWEEKLGDTTLAQYTLGTKMMDDAEAKKLLDPLLAPLLQQVQGDPYKYRFHIANDPQVNAFALPGGQVVINSGLVLKAEHGSEVLGVLAHEMTHVRERHGIRSVMGGAGIVLVAQVLLGDASGLLAAAAGAVPLFINQGYSRDFEREADRKGLQLIAAAGIDPNGLVEFFGKLRAEEAEQLAKIEDEQAREAIQAGMRVLGSHPDTEERMAYLQQQIAALPSQSWSQQDESFGRLKQAVAAFATQGNTEQE